MTKLERLFEDFSVTIANPKERKSYENKCEKFLDHIDHADIPEKIILRVPHPEYFPLFGEQFNDNTCGCNSLKAMLMIEYGKPYTEAKIWNKGKDPEKIKDKEGIGPADIARIIKTIGKRRFGKNLKVFATNYGDIRQLNYFLDRKQFPIINRPWYGPERGNHFELVLGIDNKDVYMHNPSPNCKDSGLHRMNRRQFGDWWTVGKYEFKWYLAPIPVEHKLPKYFRGRFV